MNTLRCLLLMLVCINSYAQQSETRVALVIGNSTYKAAPLKNPTNDAKDMATKLKGMGFTVIERHNLTVKQIGSTLREFRSKLTPGSVALVFFAGHGLQINGENYLPAVDADIIGEEDVPTQSLATRQIMDVLGDAKTRLNLVFLDACRNNPYARSFRSSTRGLARENAPSGTLISYATRPGSVASDGTGRNGLYTSVLLKAMEKKNQPIEQVLKQVVRGVTAASNGAQEPWMEGSFTGDFCFGSCQSSEFDNSQLEIESWKSAVRLDSIESYRAYLQQYPQGNFVSMANIAILRITNVVQPLKVDAQSTTATPSEPNISESKKTPQAENLYLDMCSKKLNSNCIYEYQFPDGGAKIVGVKVDGKLNGQKIYTHPKGIVYIGESDGTMNGVGTRINPDGSRYSGWWVKDQRQGEGIEYLGNGTLLRSGYWENNKLMRSYKLESSDFPFLPKSRIADIVFEADNKTLKSVRINQR